MRLNLFISLLGNDSRCVEGWPWLFPGFKDVLEHTISKCVVEERLTLLKVTRIRNAPRVLPSASFVMICINICSGVFENVQKILSEEILYLRWKTRHILDTTKGIRSRIKVFGRTVHQKCITLIERQERERNKWRFLSKAYPKCTHNTAWRNTDICVV